MKTIELHNHLEGTASPRLVKKIAKRNGIHLDETIISTDGSEFVWHDFLNFLDVYEQASMVIKTPRDYYDITYEYLKQCADEGGLYVEMMYSPEHAERASGIPSREHVEAIATAIDNAYDHYQIMGRIITTAVRHYGVKACEKVANDIARSPHKYIVGFGLGGDEKNYPAKLFKRTYDIARDAGLGLTAHAGEMDGPQSVIDALDVLGVSRIGHGVRSIEDSNLLARLKDENIHLEVCPSSNIRLKLFDSYADHPLLMLYNNGISVSLNSDDPPYFGTTVGKEYELAKTALGFDDKMLKQVNTMAIDAAFIDDKHKQELKKKL